MVFSEVTLAFPLMAAYAYGQGNWRDRSVRRLANLFSQPSLVTA